jgi:hypothetical protein
MDNAALDATVLPPSECISKRQLLLPSEHTSVSYIIVSTKRLSIE